MELLAVAVILLTGFWWHINNCCTFCHARLGANDLMGNGRIRYRKRGTQLPVCRCCGDHNQDKVE